MSVPFLTVIVPTRNEARHIAACLDSIVATTYPRDRLEILVVDGMSTDSTRMIVEAYAANAARCNGIALHVIPNPGRTAPAALNIGIREANGDVIARMDAHALYPPDYLPRLVEALDATGADNVGGVLETCPASEAAVPRAIAAACSHPFGVGNSRFRIGAPTNQWVDTVPFGCWRRKLFSWLGMFDEDLVRNQDDELNHRLLSRGGRILLVANVRARYFARERLRQVGRMFYQYGLFKPLVARKIGRVMTLRQLVPPALTVALLLSALLAPRVAPARWLGAALAIVYGSAIIVTSARLVPKLGLRAAAVTVAVFPTIHLSYGWGFLVGLLRWGRYPRTLTGQPVPSPLPAMPLSR